MKKIYYWCPFIDKVATIKAVINSCEGIKKYSLDKTPIIINAVGEFDDYEQQIQNKKIKIIRLSKENYIKKFPKYGFFASRFLYIFIFFFCSWKLKKLLKEDKPDYLIAHLITSLPIFLFLFSNFKTKLVLRISGFPKLNLLRKSFWKISKKKISLITTPTLDTKKYLIEQKIFDEHKIFLLKDPIIKISEVIKKKNIIVNDKILENKKFFLSIGRLTLQKNFELLIKSFSDFNKLNDDFNLVIIGEGEQKDYLLKISKNLNIDKKVFLLGYKNNIYKYMNNAEAFILSSKWEDPGFVIVEAASCRTPIVSSNCPNGPKEFLNYGKSGILFENNNQIDLLNKFKEFTKLNKEDKKNMSLMALKNVKQYTVFTHTKILDRYLN